MYRPPSEWPTRMYGGAIPFCPISTVGQATSRVPTRQSAETVVWNAVSVQSFGDLFRRLRNDLHRAVLHDRVFNCREIDLSLAHGDIGAVAVQEVGSKNQYLA